ncbi:MAG: hypothetical protein KBT06_04490, partial [Prevotellaceae bacterium]|nr:hypothetical protein [Candidatus Colivivens equi]
MRRRLSYRGGKTQGRMNDGKLWSLKKALNSSYQAITLQTNDGRWFKALLNPSKVSEDYDTKILSIPYEDICLNRKRIGTTTEGLEKTDIAAGQTFRWVENGTDWLVTLHYYQETAYFRGIAQRCKYSVDVNGNKYPVVVVGPNQISEQWHRADLAYYNELNYT